MLSIRSINIIQISCLEIPKTRAKLNNHHVTEQNRFSGRRPRGGITIPIKDKRMLAEVSLTLVHLTLTGEMARYIPEWICHLLQHPATHKKQERT